jgi:hypothetical protein
VASRDASRDRRRPLRQPRARGLCRHFAGFLAGCARGGLGALRAHHQPLILNPDRVGCSADLDSCRSTAEPSAARWDYILTIRTAEVPGIGMEVHHVSPEEVELVIRKKNWAEELLRTECSTLLMRSWHWIIPPGGVVLLTRSHPNARILAAEGIAFPSESLTV